MPKVLRGRRGEGIPGSLSPRIFCLTGGIIAMKIYLLKNCVSRFTDIISTFFKAKHTFPTIFRRLCGSQGSRTPSGRRSPGPCRNASRPASWSAWCPGPRRRAVGGGWGGGHGAGQKAPPIAAPRGEFLCTVRWIVSNFFLRPVRGGTRRVEL